MSRALRLIPARVLLVTILLTAVSTQAIAADAAGKPLKSTTGAVLRSLVIPGWGQLYNRSYIKAFAFAALEGTLIVSASHENDQMMRFKTGGDFFFEKHYRNSRNKLLWWLAGTVLLSMGDAYVDAQLYGLDVSPDLTPQNRTVGLSVTYRF